MREDNEHRLPPGWARTKLGDVQLDLGRSVDPSRSPNEVFELYSVPSHETGWPELLPGNRIGSAKQTVEPHVVLLCKINPRINRVWVVGNHSDKRKIASSEWIPFFPLAGLEPRFLAYFLRQNTVRDFLAANASGVGGSLMRVRAATLRHFPFSLAPLHEQQRIAEVLDQLMSDIDAGVVTLERLRDKLKLYRTAVLKSAMEGALTAEWRRQHPQTEPASELLKRVLVERRRRWEEEQLRRFKEKDCEPPKNWKAKYKEPVAPDTTDVPPLPEGWSWTLLSGLTPLSRGSVKTGPFGSLLKKHEHQPQGIPVLGIENIDRMRFIRGSKIHIDEKKAEELVEYDARPGDVLISRSGTVGEVCVVPPDIGKARISTNLMRIRLSQSAMEPRFFCLLFNGSPFVLKQISELCSGSTRDFLNNDILAKLRFPAPPRAEQDAIIETVEDQLSVIDHLEAELEAKLKSARALRQSILRDAFSGKLVPQNPSDEPASEVLKQIAAEREQRAREAAGKRLNGQTLRRASRARGKTARAATIETDNGRIADR